MLQKHHKNPEKLNGQTISTSAIHCSQKGTTQSNRFSKVAYLPLVADDDVDCRSVR